MKLDKINNMQFMGKLNTPYLRSEDGLGRHFGYIYQVQNDVNGDSFIGSTTKVPEEQRKTIAKITPRHDLLNKAIKTFGIENFSFKILDFADDKNTLIRKTQKYIESKKSNYNIKFKKFDELVSIDINGNVEILKDHPEKKESLFASQAAINNCFYISQESALGRCWVKLDRWNSMLPQEQEMFIKKSVKFLEEQEHKKRKFIDLVSVDMNGNVRYTREHKEDANLVKENKASIYACVARTNRSAANRCWMPEYLFNNMSKEQKEDFIAQSVDYLRKTGLNKFENTLVFVNKNGEVIHSRSLGTIQKEEVAKNKDAITSFMQGKSKDCFNNVYWIKRDNFNRMSIEDKKEFISMATQYLSDLEKYNFEPEDLISVDGYGNIREAKKHPSEIQIINENEREIFSQLSGKQKSAGNRVYIRRQDYIELSPQDRKEFFLKAIKSLRSNNIYVIKKDGSYSCYSDIQQLAEKSETYPGVIKRILNDRTVNFRLGGYVLTDSECRKRFPDIHKKEMQKIKLQRV